MSQGLARAEITKKTVLYEIPGMDAVTIRSDVVYQTTDAGPLTMDIYYPPSGVRAPAVVLVTGYPDPGMQRILGCRFKEMGSSISWCRLLAASGLAAIAYTNIEPAKDIHAVLDFARANAASLGIDENRVALWAASGNVPLALSVLMQRRDHLNCAALNYGFMLDVEGSSCVADAAKQFGFANPATGKIGRRFSAERSAIPGASGLGPTPGPE